MEAGSTEGSAAPSDAPGESAEVPAGAEAAGAEAAGAEAAGAEAAGAGADTRQASSRLPPLGLRLLALLMMSIAVLAVGEGLARVLVPRAWLLPIGEIHVDPRDRMLWQNPYLLWEPLRGTYHDGGGVVHINRMGFRAPDDLTVKKPEGVYRVLVTGDSSVYGFGVDADAMFTTRLQALLSTRFPARRFQVIDAAVPGWSTYQSLNMLRDRGLRLEPDLLIIGNLFSDNNYDTFVDREALAGLAWQRRMYELCAKLDHLMLFRATRSLYSRIRPPVVPTPRQVRMADRNHGFTGRRRVAINDYADNLKAMIREAGAIGCRSAFLMLANRIDTSSTHLPAPWDPYRDVMRDIARKAGAPLADYPAVVLAHAAEGDDALFLDRMHPTARGHALMAEAMLDALVKDAALARRLEAP